MSTYFRFYLYSLVTKPHICYNSQRVELHSRWQFSSNPSLRVTSLMGGSAPYGHRDGARTRDLQRDRLACQPTAPHGVIRGLRLASHTSFDYWNFCSSNYSIFKEGDNFSIIRTYSQQHFSYSSSCSDVDFYSLVEQGASCWFYDNGKLASHYLLIYPVSHSVC